MSQIKAESLEMPIRNYHKPGDYLYSCQICGFTIWASESRLQWDGIRCCSKCWSPKHPQLSVRGRKDNQSVPFANNPPPQFYYPYGLPEPPVPDGALIDGTGAVLVDGDGSYLIAS